jgi:hypothetical protein
VFLTGYSFDIYPLLLVSVSIRKKYHANLFSKRSIMKKIILSLLCAFCLLPAGPALAELGTVSGLELSAKSNSITVTWDANTDDAEGYYITYEPTDGSDFERTINIDDETVTECIITGLTVSTTYKIQIWAYVGDEESDTSSDTIKTTALQINLDLVDVGTIEVSLESGYSSYDYYDVYLGTSPNPSTPEGQNIDPEDAFSIPNLTTGTKYYVRVEAVYDSGDPTNYAEAEKSITVEDFSTFLSDANGIDSGCFVQSAVGTDSSAMLLFIPVLILGVCFLFKHHFVRFLPILLIIGTLIVVSPSTGTAGESTDYENLVGIKGGILLPAEDKQHDVYDSIVPVGLFYERMFSSYLSADIFAGYCRSKGYAVTSSGEETKVQTTLDLLPISASVNLNIPLHELITFYMGAGGDYWILKEKFPGKDTDYEVGGWHGKAGVKMFTGDSEYFKKGAILLEASYSQIDKFGQNDLDLGGWMFMAGVMYCF